MRDQMILSIGGIEIVEYESASVFQRKAYGAYGVLIFSCRPEIAKAGKEIKDIVEIPGAQGLTHVVLIKMEVLLFKLTGIGDIAGRKIDSCYVKAFFRQYERMAPSSAGQVQDPGSRRRVQDRQQTIDKGGSFFFIPFKI